MAELACPECGSSDLYATVWSGAKAFDCADCGSILKPQSGGVLELAPANLMERLYGGGVSPHAAARKAESDAPQEWNVGDVIMDLYEVKGIASSSGRYTAHRVHHLGWDEDLMVITPHVHILKERGKQTWEQAADKWRWLRVHPHVVTCHYVRELGGLPRIFAEYLSGGSLAEWIRTRKLYRDGPKNALKRIIDIAIQTGWGLEYAHRQSTAHLNLKPSHVRMAPHGVAKISDFGFGEAALIGTPVYWSPEWAEVVRSGAPRNHLRRDSILFGTRVDMWCWAVTVVEMFTGGIIWMDGRVAPSVLEEMLKTGPPDADIPSVPAPMADLLRVCLRENPQDRPESMKEVTASLLEIYVETTMGSYLRSEPDPLPLSGQVFNNLALAGLDMLLPLADDTPWDEARFKKPLHVEPVYNECLWLWRRGQIDDVEAQSRLKDMAESKPDDSMPKRLLAQVQMERLDFAGAVATLKTIGSSHSGAEQVQKSMRIAMERLSETVRPLRKFKTNGQSVTAASFSRGNRRIMTGHPNGSLNVWDVRTGELLESIRGHQSSVLSVSTSDDGRCVLTGGSDRMMKAWELSSGTCVLNVEAHESGVQTVALSGDGRRSLSGGWDGTLRLWDVSSGRCIRSVHHKGIEQPILSCCLGSLVQRAAFAIQKQVVVLMDVFTGGHVNTLNGHEGTVQSVDLSPDEQLLLSGSQDCTVRLWDVETAQCLRTFKGHQDTINIVRFVKGANRAVSASLDGELRIWDLATGQCIRTVGPTGTENDCDNPRVRVAAISSDGQLALFCGEDGHCDLWAVNASSRYFAPMKISRLEPAERTVSNEEVFQREVFLSQKKLEQGDAIQAALRLRVARLVPGCEWRYPAVDAWFDLYRRLPRKELRQCRQGVRLKGHTKSVNSVCFNRDGSIALSAASDGAVIAWETASGRILRVFDGHSEAIASLALSRDGRLAALGSVDGTFIVWEVSSGDRLTEVNVPASRKLERVAVSDRPEENDSLVDYSPNVDESYTISAVALSPDGRYALTADGSDFHRCFDLWEVAGGRHLRGFATPGMGVSAACFTPDGGFVLVTSGHLGDLNSFDGWDVASGARLRGFEGLEGIGRCLCVSPCGRWALRGGEVWRQGAVIGLIELWNLRDGSLAQSFDCHHLATECVSFSPDSRYALTGGRDSTMKVWDLSTGKCLWERKLDDSPVKSVCFSPDARYALSGSADGSLRVWQLDWDLDLRKPSGWDEGAAPFLENFLIRQTPYTGELPDSQELSDGEVEAFLTRRGKPTWSEDDFQGLLYELGCAGYGWLRTEGVRDRLRHLASTWRGPRTVVARKGRPVSRPKSIKDEEPDKVVASDMEDEDVVSTLHRPTAPTLDVSSESVDVESLSNEKFQVVTKWDLNRLIELAARQPRQRKLQIPGYEVLEPLHKSGMATYYRAVRQTLPRDVTVKVLPSKLVAGEAAEQKFRKELDLGKALKHPHIVRIYDGGILPGTYAYIVMEFCAGGTLESLIAARKGKITLREAASIILQVAEALAYIHEQGYVHRDVKHRHIFLMDTKGSLCKLSGTEYALRIAEDESDEAVKGGFGTPAFMPGEQAQNPEDMKPAWDVWALAATYYHALTGALPRDFQPGLNPIEAILKSNVIPIRRRDPTIPNELAMVIDRALSVEVEDRFQNGREFLEALRKVV